MNQISLYDNECFSSKIEAEGQYDDITKLSNKTVKDLLQEYPGLLIFPQSLGECKDGIDELEVIHLSGERSKFLDCKLATGNLMGFVGCGDTKLSITSRFTKNEDFDNDYFLHYMLQKVFCLNIFDLDFSTKNDGEFDLLLYIFPSLLKKACAQGLVRQYQTYKNNDANVKGTIDATRHIQNNIPFNGRIAYKNRSYSTDNPLTELVRHTIEFIKTKAFGKDILSSDWETIEYVRVIQENTPLYSKNALQKVISQNLRPFVHPYYTEYKALQMLCLQILRYEKLSYAQSDNDVHGILFDGAWLWENFLATILTQKSLGFTHADNKQKTNGIQVYKGNPRYPDFYKGKQKNSNALIDKIDENNFILDAKYKRLYKEDSDENDVLKAKFSRDDLHQIITYMYLLPARKGAFIYPLDKEYEKTESEPKALYGYGGEVWTIGVEIPQHRESFKDFSVIMEENVKKLVAIF